MRLKTNVLYVYMSIVGSVPGSICDLAVADVKGLGEINAQFTFSKMVLNFIMSLFLTAITLAKVNVF